MIRMSDANEREPVDASQEVAELIERDPRVREQQGPFEFWYRLTAPPPQPLSASFELREKARQGRLTSTVLVMVAGALIILAVPTSIIQHNPILLYDLFALLVITAISLVLNRFGLGFAGRLLVVLAVDAALCLSLISLVLNGGLSTNALPVMDIFVVEPILMTLVLLPPASVFIIGLFNITFIGLIFYLAQNHRTPDLVQLMSYDGYEVVTRPIYLMIFVIGVLYPVMRSVLRAIALSDRAKEIAKVQRNLTNREAQVAREKQQLDEGIEQMVTALTQVVQGNLRARIPTPAAQSLWPIAKALNTLSTRIYSAQQGEYKFQHTQRAAAELIQAIRHSKQSGLPLYIQPTGNPVIDAIIQELPQEPRRPLSPGLRRTRYYGRDQSQELG